MKPLETLPERVAGTISRYNMLKPGDRVGVAVSGGADSVCLLHVLNALARSFGIALAVLHLNHKLRGVESDADEMFVRELAATLGIPAIVDSAQVGDAEGNLEQAGRSARYEFFSRVIRQGCIDRVATGHTRSDQAETVLYRLIRGSGTAGLAAIRPVLPPGIIRPLLEVDRPEVLAYLSDMGLVWREDASNADLRFVRNRIRHQLLPLLAREYNPRIVSTLAQVAEIARDEESWWAEQVTAAGVPGPEIRVSTIQALNPALRRRVVRQLLKSSRGNLRGINTGHIEAILTLAESAAGTGIIALPAGTEVARSLDILQFRHPPEVAQGYEFTVEPPIDVPLPGTSRRLRLQIVEIPSTSGFHEPDTVYNGGGDLLDADAVPGALVLRNWRAGDIFQRRGRSERKVKELLQKARIPIWSRQGWPVLASGSNIVWTRRFGVAAGFEPSAATRRILMVSEGESDRPFESNGGCCASLT